MARNPLTETRKRKTAKKGRAERDGERLPKLSPKSSAALAKINQKTEARHVAKKHDKMEKLEHVWMEKE